MSVFEVLTISGLWKSTKIRLRIEMNKNGNNKLMQEFECNQI